MGKEALSRAEQKAAMIGNIRDATMKAVAEHGPSVSIKQIEQAGEFTRGALFYHFRSRDEIVAAAIPRESFSPIAVNFLGMGTENPIEQLIRGAVQSAIASINPQDRSRIIGREVIQLSMASSATELTDFSKKISTTSGLLDIGCEGYLEQGMGLRIDDIAWDRGIAHGTFYHHYPKKHIFNQVMLQRAAEIIEGITGKTQEDTLQQVLHALTTPKVKVFTAFVGLPNTKKEFREINARLARIFRALSRKLNPEIAQKLVGGLIVAKFLEDSELPTF